MSFKSGFVAISGRPNVGKSTLLNNIIKQKIAIMSPKAQTTRNTIHGVYNDTDTQIIFIDTPGVHKPHNKLGEIMNASAIGATRDVEAIIFLVSSCDEIGKGDEYLLNILKDQKAPVILVLNKIDLISKEEIFLKIVEWKKMFNFDNIVPLSAKSGENVDELLKIIKNLLPEGPKYYPNDVISDHPEEFIMAELIREKILLLTRDEIPHSIAVIIENIEKKSNGKIDVNASIIVERSSQKAIIIGKNGSMIKNIGIMSRKDIEHLLGSKINLELFVRVEKNWRNDFRYLKEFGYKGEK
ncbi:MAG: GTPase Era [Bacilli bacterium]|nr:GTPase Era [Bacilli bacterium]